MAPDIRHPKWKWLAVALAIVVAIMGFFAWDLVGPGLLIVRLTNVGAEALYAVRVASTVSAARAGDLRPGGTRLVRVPRLSEGPLWVFFRGESGVADSALVPIYIMRDSKGYVVVDVDRRAPLRWRTHMAPLWF
jgi:hypothetical protein